MAGQYKSRGKPKRTYIAQWRQYRGLTKRELAERLGISEASQGRYESRKMRISLDYLEDVAEELGCTAADLISRDPKEPEKPGGLTQAIELLRAAEEQSRTSG